VEAHSKLCCKSCEVEKLYTEASSVLYVSKLSLGLCVMPDEWSFQFHHQPNFGKHQIISGQSVLEGGDESYPESIDYFVASMPLCAAFYIRKFLLQEASVPEGSNLLKKT
jgi:hypothetical protein